MKAQEARKIAEEFDHFGKIMNDIEMSCKNGHRSIVCHELSIENVKMLISLGYSIREFEDPFNGVINNIIEW